MPNLWILGLNAYHGDSSACLLRDGEIIAAAEEERFLRIKHLTDFPREAIRYCLNEGKINLSNIDIITVNSDPRANFFKKIFYTIRHKPNFNFLFDRIRNKKARLNIKSDLAHFFPKEIFKGRYEFVEHHLAHLASTYFASSFQESLIVSVDGFGDFASCSWGIGQKNYIEVKGRIYFPHSLGAFYQALTQYLGFPNYGDEYKVMGLAPYGKPHFIKQISEIVCFENGIFKLNMKYFCFHKNKIKYNWRSGSPQVGILYSDELCKLLGPARNPHEPLEERHLAIARSAQEVFEKTLFQLLTHLHKTYPSDNLALAGGCAMNSVANGKIIEQTPFKKIYVPAAAGDEGGAMGAALVTWYRRKQSNERISVKHSYLGPSYSNEEINEIIITNKTLKSKKYEVRFIEDEKILCKKTTEAIVEGKVIGWFQGRMEWGPRALGNRSILGDPRRSDMKEILNRKIKLRESFRPFAPSILREKVAEWFEYDDDVPYMMQVLKIRQEKRCLVPAVTHVDGTGRLQTVHKETNLRYHRLISTFYDQTNVPMLLNTSFNENEPIVCKPNEALDCFLRTGMDVLVMENWMIFRNCSDN